MVLCIYFLCGSATSTSFLEKCLLWSWTIYNQIACLLLSCSNFKYVFWISALPNVQLVSIFPILQVVFLLPWHPAWKHKRSSLDEAKSTCFLWCCRRSWYHSRGIAGSSTRGLALFTSQSPTALSLSLFCSTEQHVGSWFPEQGSNPHLLQWKRGVLHPWTTREVPHFFPLTS